MKNEIKQKKYNEFEVNISELNELKSLEKEICLRLEKITLS